MNRRYSLPAEVYALVEQTPATVLLEGGKPRQAASVEKPWTQLFTSPVRVCAAYEPAQIPGLFAEIESAVAAGLSAAGFFSYECGACFEPRSAMRAGREGRPLAWFGIYQRAYGFDHDTGRFVDGEPAGLAHFRDREHKFAQTEIAAEFALTEVEYAERIAAIHEWIRAGDVYQLNFTAPMRIDAKGNAAAIYAELRARQPVEYGAFLHWRQGGYVLSFSPELFFRVDKDGLSRRIATQPMKGTAARGRTTREDREIAEWLKNDAKNLSENVMIVDLLRNDLGRIAEFGSVRAEELFAVERYRTLWQMTSTVSAELRRDVGFYDIFRALFPSGSVTGAPKVRAMQLIAELEGEPRGVYTGAVGFFSPQRSVFNVAIRTLEMEGGSGTMGIGSGVVIDSDAAAEFRECLLKAKFLGGDAGRGTAQDNSSEKILLIETMLWNGAYPLIELHLDRVTDSAEYFDFECERAAVKAALLEHAEGFRTEEPRKVRLLVGEGGIAQITDELLPADSGAGRVGRVSIASERTDSADVRLFHKTTQRSLYNLAWQRATGEGFDDVLFLNQRDEVTEGAISNVFIEKNGRWFTPPVECGLLAGVYRRHLLETRPEIEERVLTLDDLRGADAIYLSNAVRGLRRVEIAG